MTAPLREQQSRLPADTRSTACHDRRFAVKLHVLVSALLGAQKRTRISPQGAETNGKVKDRLQTEVWRLESGVEFLDPGHQTPDMPTEALRVIFGEKIALRWVGVAFFIRREMQSASAT